MPADAPVEWPVLDSYERRVLGVLVEKAKTTPDAYPLSLNALVTGCNQKSNRDPLMNLTDEQVEDALVRAQKKSLVIRVSGSGRVERWRHNLYDAWQVGKVELAILAELLLRGPQTEGELRARASRMEEIDDLDVLREVLGKLAARKQIVFLTPPGQRGTRLTHGFYPSGELEQLRRQAGTASGPVESALPVASSAPEIRSAGADRVSKLEETLVLANGEIQELRSQLAELRTTVATLEQDLKNLKQALGA
jgi:uncharacterized protein YceH (UPF0502 family)